MSLEAMVSHPADDRPRRSAPVGPKRCSVKPLRPRPADAEFVSFSGHCDDFGVTSEALTLIAGNCLRPCIWTCDVLTARVGGAVRIASGIEDLARRVAEREDQHADQNTGATEAVVVNFPTKPYNREDPDKRRLDPHGGEIPFDFALLDG